MIWVVASVLFGIYVASFSSYDKTYGSLAGVIVFLLWLWITNLALLFGAELDSELERSRELQAGLVAEDNLQLPARDERSLAKKASQGTQGPSSEAVDLREQAADPLRPVALPLPLERKHMSQYPSEPEPGRPHRTVGHGRRDRARSGG